MQDQIGPCDGISGKILGRTTKKKKKKKKKKTGSITVCYFVIFDNTGWTGWYALNTPKDLSLLPKKGRVFHVDDILYCGSKALKDTIISSLKTISGGKLSCGFFNIPRCRF
ncbi:unnamed protein product [Meganyctiphanes norvegica]|uniref:Uncharacterized protein n=1 Tax=Meganyctiphanes norvegica TaxID=48144 RepID=A0AAV2SK27_MEGNR